MSRIVVATPGTLGDLNSMIAIALEFQHHGERQQPNTALVRTVQRLSVRVQGYLPPHNFTIRRSRITQGNLYRLRLFLWLEELAVV